MTAVFQGVNPLTAEAKPRRVAARSPSPTPYLLYGGTSVVTYC
jgi:hypothetical protein